MPLSQDRGIELAILASVFIGLTIIFLSLRCYSRGVILKNFGLDDWFAILSGILYILFLTFGLIGVVHGTGQHHADLSVKQVSIALQWWWSCELVYVLSNMALKVSIGLTLLRFATEKSHKIIIWSVITVTELYGFFYFFLFLFQCRPSGYFWSKYTGGTGTCSKSSIIITACYVNSAISCIGDWTFAIFPVFIIWNLQMNKRTKFSVGVILAMGALASTATIIRIPYVNTLNNASDFLHATTGVAILSGCETGIGLLASNIATLRPLIRRFNTRSEFMGDDSSDASKSTSGWPADHTRHEGFMRSEGGPDCTSCRGNVEMSSGLGVTTRISTGSSDLGEVRTKVNRAILREQKMRQHVSIPGIS